MSIAILDSLPASDDQLLLDLLNTTPVVDGETVDQLDDGVAPDWQEGRGGTGSREELSQLRQARSLLQEVVRGQAPAATLAPVLDAVSYRPMATDDGISWMLKAPSDDVLAARAVLAWDQLRVSAPGRLRPCANDECALFLIDRSKANTARWCSMAVCGNRMKARRHYQRQRESQA